MLQELSGKVVWITGAGTGIGESAAIKLAEEGCKVALSGRRISVLDATSSNTEILLPESCTFWEKNFSIRGSCV